MINKDQIHKMLYLSQLKRQYLEECLVREAQPDYHFLQLIAAAELNPDSLQNMDLTPIKGEALKIILPLLKCQNYVEQIVISSSSANEVTAELTRFLEQNQVDVQIRKRIPQLDLNMISASSGNLIQSSQRQPNLYKSPSNVHFNTDRIQQQIQSDRYQKQKRSPLAQINTKIINLNLKTDIQHQLHQSNCLTQPPLQQQPQHPSQQMQASNQLSSLIGLKKTEAKRAGAAASDFNEKIEAKQAKKYLTNTKSSNNKLIKKQSSENVFEPRKKSSHSFSKHKNTSSSPMNNSEAQENLPQQRHISAYSSSKTLSKNISVKNILDQQQSKARLGQIVKSENQDDISIHLKNLINFCNQSIMKKSQEFTSVKVAVPTTARNQDTTIIKLTELTEEDNPETARFNSEEDTKKSYNSKGLQKLLQLKTQPAPLMSVFRK